MFTIPLVRVAHVQATARALIIFSVVTLGFGQLLKFPTNNPDFQILALDLLLLITSGLLLTYRFLTTRTLWPSSWLSLTRTLFIVVLTIGLITNPLQLFSAFTPLLYLLRLIAYLYIADVVIFSFTTIKHIYEAIQVLLLAFFFTIVGGIIQYFLIPDFHFLQFWGWDNHLYRLAGTFLDPGFTGLFLTLGSILAFPLLLLPPRQHSLLFFTSQVLTIFSLALTFSRASYVAFFASLTTWLLLTRKYIMILGLAVSLILAIVLAPKPAGEGVNLTRTSTVNFRFQNWDTAWQIFQQSPIVGVGYNRYRYAQHQLGFNTNDDWESSHSAAGVDNSGLFFLATSGVVGLISLLTFTILLLISLYRLSRLPISRVHDSYLSIISSYLPQVAITMTAAVFAHGMFHNSWVYPHTLFYLSVTIGLALTVGKLTSMSLPTRSLRDQQPSL